MMDEQIQPDPVKSHDAGREAQPTKNNNGSGDVFVRSLAVSSKWLFALTVIGSAIIAVVLFVYGFLLSLLAAYHGITSFSVDMSVVKQQLATAIQIIDLFLVATVFYLIALGFYELFIAKAPLPGWVEIRNLDDLKSKLLGLTVIALAVIFLGFALTLKEGTGIFEFGAAVALMIAAISAYLWVKH